MESAKSSGCDGADKCTEIGNEPRPEAGVRHDLVATASEHGV
jgi:hypothetical protein